MEFIDYQKETIIQENLYRNLVSHLTSLLEVGIITQETFLSGIEAVQNHISTVEILYLDKSWRSIGPSEGQNSNPIKNSNSEASKLVRIVFGKGVIRDNQ